MDRFGSAQIISSKVVIKDEIDIDCEDHRESEMVKIKEESLSPISISDSGDDNVNIKKDYEEDDFVIDDYEKRCCVWLKENPTPLLLQEPIMPAVSLPEGTQIIKVKPVSYTKPHERSHKNNESIEVPQHSKDSSKKWEKPIKDELDALEYIWASKLLQLEETQRILAEDLINQILKKGFFKDLTPNTSLYDPKYQV